MEKKKNNVWIIVLLVIIIVGLAGYICYDKFLVKGGNGNSDIITNNNVDNNKKVNDDLTVTTKVINFDKTKCINSNFADDSYNITRFGTSNEINGVSFYITPSNEQQVAVNVRYDMLLQDESSNENTTNSYNEEKTLTFNKKVEMIFGGLFDSDGIQGTIFIFLLEDGSIEYMKMADIYESKKFEHKPVSGVSDIVRFDNIAMDPKQGAGTKYTAIAYKMDGTYYDLSEFISVN